MKLRLIHLLVLVFAMLFAAPGMAKEPLVFTDEAQEARYNELTLELRCLVCQNQNLADSDAPLAQDLRKEIYEMLQKGQSNEEIKTFLVDRYGDFVLYRPPMKSNTIALWLMPAVLFFIGGLALFFIIRKRSRLLAEQTATEQEKETT